MFFYTHGTLLSVPVTLSVMQIVGKPCFTHPVILRFAGYFRVTKSFTKIGGASTCMHSGWGNGRSEISYRGAACFMGPITSNGREATVTERAARSNPQRAVGEAHCELFVTQKVIDAHLKALSTPWWTESSYTCYTCFDLMYQKHL